MPSLEPGDGIDADELERALQNSPWSEGTVLIVSTGRGVREQARRGHDPAAEGSPGLLPSVVPWLHEHQPSFLVTDVACDRMQPDGAPHRMPLHVLALVGLGIHLIDNASLAELTKVCADRERNRVAFSLSVPRFVREPVRPSTRSSSTECRYPPTRGHGCLTTLGPRISTRGRPNPPCRRFTARGWTT